MSQRAEKYARRMERRMDNLERDMEAITAAQSTHETRISCVEDDLAVWRAAVSARELKKAEAAAIADQEWRAARREELAMLDSRRNMVLSGIALALLLAVCIAIVAKAYDVTPVEEPETAAVTGDVATAIPVAAVRMEQPEAQAESIDLTAAVPMDDSLQTIMQAACEEYDCPYPLALAVAQVESQFDMDIVGASGEVGIMQLNPGPNGSYHDELQAITGLDPTTASGNIAGGCYKLGLYLDKYQEVELAAMAYNMGESGAQAAWENGITSTGYSRMVKEAMDTWTYMVSGQTGA